jgi:hypothetical protein
MLAMEVDVLPQTIASPFDRAGDTKGSPNSTHLYRQKIQNLKANLILKLKSYAAFHLL